MKPYIVRPAGPGGADVFNRATDRPVGWLVQRTHDWRALCQMSSSCWSDIHSYRADAAEALWWHYRRTHKALCEEQTEDSDAAE